MAYDTILFEKSNGVARVTLNRPASLNALNTPLAQELLDAIVRCHSDSEARVVVITGAGRAFSSGGDVKAMAQSSDPSATLRLLTGIFHSAFANITRLPKPVIAGVNGAVAGAGMGLVMACDLAIASEKAKFTVAFNAVALSPDGGTTYFLPRYVGLKKAMDLTMSNRALTAMEACDLGLVNEVVPDHEFAGRLDDLAAKLAQGPTVAFGRTKQLFYRGLGETLETHMESERHSVSDCGLTADFREAVQAFVEKRAPKFEGR
ncbi:MAG: enoyl-CoA hydratase [Chloroflexi bacterium]|nr:enoyl-CoA hydratase [Chloroflexota bacterium]